MLSRPNRMFERKTLGKGKVTEQYVMLFYSIYMPIKYFTFFMITKKQISNLFKK